MIQPWLEDDQVEEVVKQLTASFPGSDLLQNNQYVFNFLLVSFHSIRQFSEVSKRDSLKDQTT